MVTGARRGAPGGPGAPAGRGRPTAISPARIAAFAVIRRVFEHGAFADRALQSEASGLEPRDRALAMTLAYGTVQRRATLDHVAGQLTKTPLDKLDPPVLAALRLGIFQLLFLAGVPQHAAVNDAVELAKRGRPEAARLVNAVLRRAAREGPDLLAGLDDATPEGAAVLHSVPLWLAQRWWDELGPEGARPLLARSNEAAESALRVNTLRATRDQVQAQLPVPARAAPRLPDGLVLEAPFDAHRSELFTAGADHPPVARLDARRPRARPAPGQRILDLCAAPGGKTTHLAALIENEGEIVAVERHPGRAAALERTCERVGAGSVRVVVADAAEYSSDRGFDAVLVDPPCSGLGTLQARPDLRWHASPEGIERLAALQKDILAAGAAATAPGGALLYSVCTISRSESEDVIDAFLGAHHEFEAEDLQNAYPEWAHPRVGRHLQLLPDRDRTDGFFIARLRRSEAPIT